MSGSNVAYHLRPNKAVERQLFIELLSRLEVGLPRKFSDYCYYGFGGIYMEDFRLSQRHLGLPRMVSIEEAPNALARQKFNRPANCIRFLKQTSKEFVDGYHSDEPAIVWLDYTRPQWREQLLETETLVRALAPYSILKVSFPAQPSALGNPPPDAMLDQHSYRLEKLQAIFGELVPNDAKPDDMKTRDFPRLLARIVHMSLENVFGALSERECSPLAIYKYDDGTPMLTITMLVGRKDAIPRVRRKAKLGSWKFATKGWDDIISINTPDLTLKERIFIEGLLPRLNAEQIQRRLGFFIAEKRTDSIEALDNYVSFHRQLPFFLKVLS